MRQLLQRPGQRFAMAGQAYKGEPLPCTLLACWEQGHAEPWLLLTDLPPSAGNPCWYAWRAWIEQGFKVAKSGGLNWQHTRMTRPDRAERQFLAIAVTTLWLVAVGAEAERATQVETIGPLPADRTERADAGRPRRIRLFALGMATVLVAWIKGAPLPQGKLSQECWPGSAHISPITEAAFLNSG
jgi:hypothetical protein